MARTLPAVLERWSTDLLLFVPTLPGFQINAPNRSQALELARQSLPGYLAWMDALELDKPVESDAKITITEEMEANGDIGPRFMADLRQPDAEEIELALTIGRAAISSYIDLLDGAEDAAARHQIEPLLRHIAEQDRWYATRLGQGSDGAFRSAVFDDVVTAAGSFEDAIDAAVESSATALVVTDGEEWTLGKLLRRRTGHLSEHLSAMAARG